MLYKPYSHYGLEKIGFHPVLSSEQLKDNEYLLIVVDLIYTRITSLNLIIIIRNQVRGSFPTWANAHVASGSLDYWYSPLVKFQLHVEILETRL